MSVRKPKLGPLPRLSRRLRVSKTKDLATSLDRACRLIEETRQAYTLSSPLIVQAVFRDLMIEIKFCKDMAISLDERG